MKRLFAFFSSRRLTAPLLVPGVVGYALYLASAGGQNVMLSTGFEVLQGGVDLSGFARSPFGPPYLLLVAAHVLSRFVASAIAEGAEPSLEAVDAEMIVAEADAYSVVAPAEDWLTTAESALSDTSFTDSDGRAVFWRDTRPGMRQLWQVGLWLIVVMLFVSMYARRAASVPLGAGELMQQPQGVVASYDWRAPSDTRVMVPYKALGVSQGSIDSAMGEDLRPRPKGALARPVTAEVVVDTGRGQPIIRRVGMWPPAIVRGDFISVASIGMAPRFVISRGGVPVLDSFIKTRLLPGEINIDDARLGELPYVARLSIAPEPPFDVRLANYGIELVDEAGTVVASGTVGATSGSLKMGDLAIDVPETSWWVAVVWTRDPATWGFIAGLLLLVVGLIARIAVAWRGRAVYSFVVAPTDHGPRLYVGMECTPVARRRENARFRALVRSLEGRARTDR